MKNPPGRPKIAIDLELAKAMIAAGVPHHQVAAEFGITRQTLIARLKDDPTAGPHPGPMEAAEFIAFKKRFALTYRQIGELVGLGETHHYTRRASKNIPAPVAVAIRFYNQYPQHIKRLLRSKEGASK